MCVNASYYDISPKNRGRNKLISGTKVIKRSVTISTPQNGRILFITFSIFEPLTLQPTNNAVPTGGVAIPIQRLKMIIIAK